MPPLSEIIRPLPELIKPGWVAEAAFYFIIGVTMAGAIIAVFFRRIIYNVLGLAVCLMGVAGIFVYLSSEFLALMEILVYVGAITITIVFAVMLSDPMYREMPERSILKVGVSGLVSLILFLSLSRLITDTPWTAAAEMGGDWTLARVGKLLLTRFDLVFELISLVLIVAILGAVIIAGQGRKQRSSQ